MAQQPAKPVTTFRAAAKTAQPETPVNFIFNKDNYKLFIIAIAIVALGFVLMAGTTDIYNTTKTIVAPVVVLAGFGVGFYAILRKPASKA